LLIRKYEQASAALYAPLVTGGELASSSALLAPRFVDFIFCIVSPRLEFNDRSGRLLPLGDLPRPQERGITGSISKRSEMSRTFWQKFQALAVA
jgi:hypothetical protein